ncbi:MAG: PilW family protein [Methylococcales bacterium]|nr:PilW family protein [Methylococcales bacterium]
MKNKRHQLGLSLLEVMIALLLGAFLLGGVLKIFIGSNQTYMMQENLSRLQENGRFAMTFISRDIRMTGYWGCMKPSAVNVDVTGTNGASGAPDTITLRSAFVRPPTLTGMSCGTPVTAAATEACPQGGVPPNLYTDNSSVITYSIVAGSLRRTTNCVTGADADIVQGIENMQILYGADTDGNGTPNYFVPAGTSGLNMAQVVSVRLSLLVVSLDDNLTQQPLAYTYNGATVTPADRRIRRVFTTTVAVRNRLS